MKMRTKFFVVTALAVFTILQAAALDLDLKLVSSFQFTNSSIDSVAAFGDHVYADEWLWPGSSKQQGRIAIFDVRDPANPQRIGSYPITFASAVAFSGKYAFVVESGVLSIIDLGSPREPRKIGECECDIGSDIGILTGLAVSETYAFVTTDNNFKGTGLIIDISKPESPTLIASFVLPARNHRAIALTTKYALVKEHSYSFQDTATPQWTGSLHIIDISNPAEPVRVGSSTGNGSITSLAVSENRAFLIQDGKIWNIDLADPSNPQRQRVGVYDTSGTPDAAAKLAISGNRLYVANWRRGLEVIDINNPANPVWIGSYVPEGISGVWDVAIAGSHAFTAHLEHGLGVINIENPANPSWVGGYYDGYSDGYDDGRSSGLFLSEKRAYVRTEGGGVHLFDISAPRNPVRIGSWKPHTWSTNFAFSGNYAFIADAATGIRVFELTDPARPRHVSTIKTAGNPQGLAASRNHLFVADGTNGLVIFDVSSPAAPQLVGNLRAGSAYAVSLSGNYAGVFWKDQGVLSILDVRDPSNPWQVHGDSGVLGTGMAVSGNYAYWFQPDISGNGVMVLYPVDGGNFPPGKPLDSVRGNYGLAAAERYIIGFSSGGFFVLDAEIPDQPARVGSFLSNDSLSSLAASGRYVYLVEGGQLKVIELILANPQRRALDFSIPDVDRVQIAGRYGYVKHLNGKEASIIDFSNPVNPKRLGIYTSNNLLVDFALDGSLGVALEYLGEDTPILRVIDLSDPSNPTVKSSYQADRPVTNVIGPRLYGKLAISQGRAFVVDHHFVPILNNDRYSYGGVDIFDITNPESPVRLGRYSTYGNGQLVSGSPVNLAVRANFLYLIRADGYIGGAGAGLFTLDLEVVDIEDPTNPVALSSRRVVRDFFTTRTHERDAPLALSKHHAFVLDPRGELAIFDISHRDVVKPVGSYQFASQPHGLTLSGSRVYLRSSASLEVLDIQDPTTPRRLGGNSNLDLQIIPNSPPGLAVWNGQIFAAAGTSGLLILHDYQPLRFEQIIRGDLGSPRLRLTGPPGVPGVVQRSSDLRNWSDWLPINFSESSLDLTDPEASSAAHRFYRIVVP